MADSKPAIKSLGILSGIGSIGTLLALIAMVRDIYDSIPPELWDDTRVFFTVTVVALVQQAIALYARWRAVVPIKGLIRQKHDK